MGGVVAILRVVLLLPVLVRPLVLVVSAFLFYQASNSRAVFAEPQRTPAEPPKGSVLPPKGSVCSVLRGAIRGEAVAPGMRHSRLLKNPRLRRQRQQCLRHCLSGVQLKAAHGRQHPCSGQRLTGQVCLPLRLLPLPRSSYLCFLFATS